MRPSWLFSVFLGLGSMLSSAQNPPARKPRFVPSPPSRRLNLSGIWQEQIRIDNGSLMVVKIRIDQTGNEVKAELTQTDPSVDGKTIFEGRFTDNLVIVGRSPESQSTAQNPQWYEDRVLIDDPDHIRFEKVHMEMARASARPDDIPCDSGNSYGVKADFALVRGAAAVIQQKDYKKGACWLTIGAAQGQAKSQSLLAYLFYAGSGVEQNDKEAFAWAQKSAEQKDIFGEMILSALYEEGKGVTPDAQKSAYWAVQARDHPEYEAIFGQRHGRSQQQTSQAQRAQPHLSQQQIRQGVTGLLVLGVVFAALANADTDSGGDGDTRRSDGLNHRYDALKSSCAAGFTSSCKLIGEKPPNDQQ